MGSYILKSEIVNARADENTMTDGKVDASKLSLFFNPFDRASL